jgi:large repetitive protein
MSFLWNSKKALKSSTRIAPNDAIMVLEDRILMDAEANISITGVPPSISPGGDFSLNVVFDNVPDGDPGSITGFGPYLNIYVPVNGRDGGDPDDGPDGVTLLSATYQGSALSTQTLTFTSDSDGNGQLDVLHPFFKDASGNAIVINVAGAQAGDKLVVAQLPFGSFAANQTPANVLLNFRTSPLADINSNIAIDVSGGFRFGRDALDNPTVDPSVLSNTVSTSLSVSGPELSIVYNGPNNDSGFADDNSTNNTSGLQNGNETATGPNYEQTLTIRLSIPTGQTINALNIQDFLPSSFVYRGIDSIIVNGVSFTPAQITAAITDAPTFNQVVNPADNTLNVSLGNVTGTAATYDVQVNVRFYVNNVKFDGSPVIDPFSANTTESVSNVRATGISVPVDTQDPTGVAITLETAKENVTGNTARDHVLDNEAIAIQKSAVVVTDNNAAGLSAGDIVEYSLDIQISDYFTFGDIVLTDYLGDSQSVDGTFNATFEVIENGVTTGVVAFANFTPGSASRDVGPENATIISGGNFVSTYNAVTGETTSVIRLSQELINRNLIGGDGVLAGDIARDNLAGGGKTTIRVVFHAVVLQTHDADTRTLSEVPFGQGDAISNRVGVIGSVRNNASPNIIQQVLGVDQTESDDAQASLSAPVGSLTKGIEYVNGAIPLTDPVTGDLIIRPGDTITYRLTYTLPLTQAEDFFIEDFLPQPVFNASELVGAVVNFTEIAGNPAPGAGQVRVTTGDTFTNIWDALPGTTAPTVQVDAANNSFRINFGTFDRQPATSSTVDILFTLTVRDLPFAPGLLLTNQAAGSESSTYRATTTVPAITQITLVRPDLSITKGIVASNNTNATLSGTPAIAFNAPGTAGARFTGLYNDGNVGTLNTNISNIDAGDNITFAVILNDNGNSPTGAYDVRFTDTIPLDFNAPATAAGLNIVVQRGDGTVLTLGTNYTVSYNLVGRTFTVELVDPSVNQGAIQKDDAPNGGDIIIVSYDLTSRSAINPNITVTNTAALTNYAAREGGQDITAEYDLRPGVGTGAFLREANIAESAEAFSRATGILKTLVSSSDANSIGENIAPGETATFNITYTFREGVTQAVVLSDFLPAGYTYVSSSLIFIGSDLVASGPDGVGSIGTVVNAPNFNFGTSNVNWNLGNVTNSAINNIYNANDTIVVQVTIRNTSVTFDGASVSNAGVITDATEAGIINFAGLTNVLPTLLTFKLVDTNVNLAGIQNNAVQAGDTVEYTIIIRSPTNAQASSYDVAVNDLIPTNTTFVLGSLVISSTGNPSNTIAFNGVTNSIDGLIDELDAGESVTVKFRVTVNPTVLSSSIIDNTANISYTSQPGTPLGDRTFTDAPSASFNILPPTLDKVIFNTSVGNDTSTNVLPGEVVTYRITFGVADGVTSNLSLADLLQPGLLFGSARVIAIGSDISGSSLNVGDAATFNSGTNTINFTFGTLSNIIGGSASANSITVEVQAIVDPAATGPANGAVIFNNATLSYSNGTTTVTVTDATPPSVTVIEPILLIDKTVNTSTADAGDIVTFTVVISHAASSTAAAQDILLADLIPSGLQFIAGSVTSTSGTITTGNIAGDTSVAIDVGTLALGNTITVTYQARVSNAVLLGSTITNTASATYDSIAGAPDPDGAGPVAPQDGRNRAISDIAQVNILSNVTIAKSIVNTSVGNDTSANVVIGELVTYRIRMSLSEGTTNSLIIRDFGEIAPQFLQIVSASIISLGNGSNITTSLSGAPVVNSVNGTVVFDFGSVTNAGNNIITGDDDTIIVEVRALVADLPANARNTVITNDARVSYDQNGSVVAVNAAPTNVTVVEPELAITKVIDTNLSVGGNQTTAVDAGDTVRFTITLNHTAASNSNAFDVSVSDLIDPRYQLVGGSVVITGATGVVTTGTVSALGTPLTIDFSTIPLGSIVTITFDALVLDTAVIGESIPNSANVAYDSIVGTQSDPDGAGPLLPQGGRGNSATAVAGPGNTAPLSNAVTLAKALVTTSVGNDTSTNVQIGELVTYRITLTLPEGTLRNLVVSDLMEFGLDRLEYVSARVVSSAEAGGSGIAVLPSATITGVDSDGDGINDRVNVNFGDIVNPGDNSATNNTVVVEVVARVVNVAANVRGDVLTNNAQATFTANAATQTIIAAPVNVTIVEPSLQITKVADVLSAQPGDIITYTVTVGHAIGSNGTAYDIRVSDILPVQFALVAPPIIITNPGGATVAANGVDISVADLDVGETLVVQYQVRVVGSPPAGTTVANNASVNWDSLPGVDAGRAPATPPRSSAFVGLVGFDKIIVSTSLPETGDAEVRAGIVDLAIDETVTWDLVVVLPNGATTVRVSDFLPSSVQGTLQLVGSPIITLGSGVTTTLPGTLVQTDTNGDGIADTLFWDFGTATNSNPGQSSITIRVTTLVLNRAENISGDQLATPARLDYGSGTISDVENLDIVEPLLNIVKTVDVATGDAGDILTYTVRVSHQPGSTSTAYDLLIADLLDADEELVPGSVVISGTGAPGAAVTSGNGATDTRIGVSDTSLNRGQELVITYQTRIRDGVVGGSTVQSNATLGFDSAAGAGGRAGTAPSSILADDALVTVPVNTTLAKSIIATSDALTGATQYNPAITDLHIGETATFEIRYTLNEVALNGLIITDTLVTPNGVLMLSGTPTVIFGAGVTGTAPTPQLVDTDGDGIVDRLVFNFGTVSNVGDNNPVTGEIIIRYTAVVSNVAANIAADQLDLPVRATYTPLNGVAVVQNNPGVSVEIVEPLLNIVKTVNTPTGDAGDILTYTVRIGHQPGSTSPAYDLQIADLLDADEELVPGSVVISGSGAAGATVGMGASVNDASLGLGEELIITYQTRIRDGVIGGSTIQSNATLSFDSLAGTGGRLGTAPSSILADDAVVNVPINTTLVKNILTTSNPETGSTQHRATLPDLAIGETAEFEVRFTLNEIRLNGLVLTDTLVTPSGVLTLIGTPSVVFGPGVSGTLPTPMLVDTNGDGVPDLLRFDFGDVANAGDNNAATGEIIIRYTARVSDVPANINGDQLNLPVQANYRGLDNVNQTLAVAGPSIDIVEPVLQIDTTIDKSQIVPGETAYITVTVTHTGASTLNASDLSILSQIPAGLVPTGPIELLNVPLGTSVSGLTVTSPSLTLGGTLVYRIPITAATDADPLLNYLPRATLNYDSLPGVNTAARAAQTADDVQVNVIVSSSNRAERSIVTYTTGTGTADRRSFNRLPRLDPIYSGSGDPGSTISLTLTDNRGANVGSSTSIVDAGGNWLSLLPSVTVFDLLDSQRLEDYFNSTRLFDNFTGLFQEQSLLGFQSEVGRSSFGSDLSDNVYTLSLQSSAATYNAADESGFNARTYFGPAWRNEIFGAEAPLSIGKVFRDRAEYSVDSLYESASNPLGLGVNKYNAEFLASSGLVSSSR